MVEQNTTVLGAKRAPRLPRNIASQRSITQRSRVSNGKQLFLGSERPNENSVWGRRLKDLMSDHFADLGGLDVVTVAEKMLVRRAATLAVQCEMMEQQWAVENDGAAPNEKVLICYQRVTGALRRCLRDLGLKRRAKDVKTLTLDAIMQERSDG
jgi:hypothetical protein